MDSTGEDTTGGGMYVDMDEVTHEEYQENFAEFMDDIQNHVKKLAAESSRAPQDAYEAFQGKTNGWVSLACLLRWSFLDSLLFTLYLCSAFSSAVDWTENWLRGLLCFHVILFVIVVLTRKNTTIQSMLFLYICFLVLLAEYLNTFCAENWESFSTQNYFDTHGSFAAVVYAAPLLVIALLQMVILFNVESLCMYF